MDHSSCLPGQQENQRGKAGLSISSLQHKPKTLNLIYMSEEGLGSLNLQGVSDPIFQLSS